MRKRIKEIIVRYDDKQSFIYGNTLGEVVGELVRCKECKWGKPYSDKQLECDALGLGGLKFPDDFCSYGERKESE